MKLKKVLIICMSAVMTMSLIGCGGSGPKDQVKKDINAIKKESTENIVKSMGDSLKDLKDYGISKKSIEGFTEKLKDFDYEILDEKVDGDKATVNVKITTYDFKSSVKKSFQSLYQKALNGEIKSEKELYAYIDKEVFGSLNKLKDKTLSKKVKINCKKKDGKWETDIEQNQDFQNAILGDLEAGVQEALSSK